MSPPILTFNTAPYIMITIGVAGLFACSDKVTIGGQADEANRKARILHLALLILALGYTIFGVYSYYGDRRDIYIRGASDIRFDIDIGAVSMFGPRAMLKT